MITQLFQPLVKTSFVQSKYWANKFAHLSIPISLAFNFKCYFILLILIYDKIRLSVVAVCPSGPCKNYSLRMTCCLANAHQQLIKCLPQQQPNIVSQRRGVLSFTKQMSQWLTLILVFIQNSWKVVLNYRLSNDYHEKIRTAKLYQ